MTRTYDARPDLEAYDALTVRGIAKFALAAAVLIGSEILADRFGLADWLHGLIQLAWIGVGLKVISVGMKAWMSGDYPPGAPEGPRYSETGSIRFVSARTAAVGEIAGGSLLIAQAVFKLIQISSGA